MRIGDKVLVALCAGLLVAGCATNETVRRSAEFTNVQLGVLQAELDRHFARAAGSVERQKAILSGQFGTNRRLGAKTATIVDLAASENKAVTAAFSDLKKSADAVRESQAAGVAAQRAYDESLEALVAAPGPSAEAFAAVMTPLQALARDESEREAQLAFFAAYAKAVAGEVRRLREADAATSPTPPGT